MVNELIMIKHEEFDELICKGNRVGCLVLENGEHGLTLAAIDYVWPNGNAVLITTRKPGTTGTPAHLEPLGPSVRPLAVGDYCLYWRGPDQPMISPMSPETADVSQRIAAARREFLPELFGN